MSSDYAERAKRFGLSSKEEILELVSASDATFLDVRTKGEVDKEPFSKVTTEYTVVHLPCTMNDATELTEKAAELLPNKDGNIVTFCGIGGRASVAKEALKKLGYRKVYNGGGLKDLDYLSSKS
mmetsp:Transcript_32166/g.36573  ORF Transcript_32166/g.36573 Transcript_32166/m.36573 type:complete len:124 (+) Transcript_32166:134-505(+)|eukprot:CAMPEP_0194130554 /NCGR_PEP_ID=MMETSP0152-20130528/1580_1 /TAXON_ID=1049557 /ORGANISM="Thalassiothrix antarctica, Strain L6-D1" /LENGTH=123 /DNA_ID=CAMNT_0038825117 /DNA_START=96 /DNA_END=467 /DNA_ORIENTATION=+